MNAIMNPQLKHLVAPLAILGSLTASAVIAAPPPAHKSDKIVFNRDIRPLLSDNCFACHGPDKNKRQADLRLDQPNRTVVPGNVAGSELIQRIVRPDSDASSMPPASFHKKLTLAQKSLLTQWIKQGAAYQKHWAYEPPIKFAIPADKNAIDFLVGKRLASIGLKPSPTADRRTLVRRLYFDLLGLPPTANEVNAFVTDKAPGAYNRLTEQLLANPHYGERMAQGWLDAVRFADTIGYHSDNPRNIWPYRDYVINSFNSNKPFDRFTREQLAGDLLQDANQETRVASAYNRLILTTEEGGAQAKDYEARYLTDRVRAVGTVWLGQTTGCSQCHDHKFDPIKTKDFYSLGAFFADIDEAIIGGREPGMLVPTPEQAKELARRTDTLEGLRKSFDGPHPDLRDAEDAWIKSLQNQAAAEKLWNRLKPAAAQAMGGTQLSILPDNSILAKGDNPERNVYTITAAATGRISGIRIEALPDGSLPSQGPGRAGNGNFVLTGVTLTVTGPEGNRSAAFSAASASVEQSIIAEGNPYKKWSAASVIDPGNKNEAFGWAVLPEIGKPQSLVLTLATPINVAAGESLQIGIRQNHGSNHNLGRFRISTTADIAVLSSQITSAPEEIISTAAVATRSPEQTKKLDDYFKSFTPALATLRKQIADATKERDDYEASIPRCIVSRQNSSPRLVRILPRGNFLDETGEIVKPATPAFLPAQTGGTRLDLANWIVNKQNPLTARAVMNRMWKQFFGNGLSKVIEDLGAQGEPPSNPDLLDWLACEFMDSGWDVKHMVRIIINSATYKQVSTASKELMARDPYNREYARQGRFRLEAEEVRDNALTIAGLISLKIGGPSVKPYQPERYWDNLNFPVREYVADTGESQYRRGIYTWWQRSFVHPSMLAFDAPTREECAADRGKSNIPQQALVLLNDPTYVEASRVFAQRILKDSSGAPALRIAWACQQAIQRSPTPAESATLLRVYEQQRTKIASDPASCDALLKVGLTPVPDGCDRTELAAWTHVARVLLNLHETITRP